MLDYSIMKPEGILMLKPCAPLTKEDWGGVGAAVDSYLSNHGRLHGALILARRFPGWKSFGGLTAHLRFVHKHHNRVDRVAVVMDSPVAGMMEALGKHFTTAEVRHFSYADDAQALDWLEKK